MFVGYVAQDVLLYFHLQLGRDLREVVEGACCCRLLFGCWRSNSDLVRFVDLAYTRAFVNVLKIRPF
jgi:hypothetical protein